MKQLKHFALFLAAVAAFCLAACNDFDSDGANQQYLQSVVTFTGNNPVNNTCQFDLYPDNSNQAIRLYAQGTLATEGDKSVRVGDRLLMYYVIPGDRDIADGGEVTIMSLNRTLGGDFSNVDADSIAKCNAEIYIISMSRTGNYLNIFCQMPQVEGRTMSLNASAETLDGDYPEFYLTSSYPAGNRLLYSGNYVASFDISGVWNRSDISGVRVRVNNTNNPDLNLFTFKK